MSDLTTPTAERGGLYWAYNCPLQMHGNAKNGWRCVNYMPRKETCCDLEYRVTAAEMPQFCRNAAAILRNLAALFDAMADGKIDRIYCPDKDVAKAIAERQAELAESAQ